MCHVFDSLFCRALWTILYPDLFLSTKPHLWSIYWRLCLWEWRWMPAGYGCQQVLIRINELTSRFNWLTLKICHYISLLVSTLVIFKFRVIWTIGQCYGSSSSWWKRVLGRHHWHSCACHLGCFAAGSAVALPSQTEGQREQHTNRLLFHQPYCQLWICYSR